MSSRSITWQRLWTFAAMAVAFAFMASIFSPDTTRAGDAPGVSTWTPRATSNTDSVNPHDGLASLGQIDGLVHTVQIYSTPVGVRYSIIDNQSGETVGTLLSPQDVERFFPEITLRGLRFDTQPRTDADVDSIGPLMLADPPCDGF